MLGRLLSRPAKLRAKEDVVSEDIVSMARAFALAMSERDGVTPEQQLAAREDEQKLLVQERARNQALEQKLAAREDEQKLLAQERARSQALELQLAAREDEQKLLVQERARNQALEQQVAAHEDEQKFLAQERARSRALELQLAVQRDATPDPGRIATESSSDRMLLAPDKPVAAWLPASDKPVTPGNHKSLTLMARLTAPEAPGNGEAARLMIQGRLLLDQGKIIAARSELERAAESGSALALFLLAETYDPAMLSAWGISGRRGNVTKAQKLYAKAVVEGVHEAKYRLSVLR